MARMLSQVAKSGQRDTHHPAGNGRMTAARGKTGSRRYGAERGDQKSQRTPVESWLRLYSKRVSVEPTS